MDAAWLAGFFDGEGWVGAHYANRQSLPIARIALVQRDRGILDEIRDFVGIETAFIYPFVTGVHCLVYQSTAGVRGFGDLVLEDLIIKRRPMRLALQLSALTGTRAAPRRLSPEERAERLRLGEELREITKRRRPGDGERIR